jgi:ferrochelatase
MSKSKIGVLLCNIGTPDEPTPKAVKRYLQEFLSDRRVVEIPRLIWWPILYGLILQTRPKKSAKLYQKIWTEQGSPLLYNSRKIAELLEKNLNMPIALGMHYGNPSIKSALEELRKKAVTKILILPLYPQYSATTTASTFDIVANVLKKWRNLPEIRTIYDYADNPLYIKAISESIQLTSQERLLFSFHGIPQRYITAGDPYEERCKTTVQLIANELQLKPDDYLISFQSRLGKAEWLSPYTDKTLQTLPRNKTTHLKVICPGFAVDCLETLEEIAILGKQQFLENGGEKFTYISALNDSQNHIDALSGIIKLHIANW